ncbi:uncharacterized protein [Ptychodera flava]|uniref:uncharacterized protein isoform X1 n=1 Tax=Ptychodera flava TaxID=63121 RepID=UPI00396A97DD
MKEFKWHGILREMKDEVPYLLDILVGVAVPVHREATNSSRCGDARMYPISTVYGILMQQRHRELSLLQRINTVILSAGKADSKTYDRFNRLGVCLSHQQEMNILEYIGGRYQDEIITKVTQGRKFQITGDNLDLKENVRQLLVNNKNKDHHWFTLILVFDRIDFSSFPNETPKANLHDMPPSSFIPSKEEKQIFRSNIIILVARIIVTHLTKFKHLASVVPDHIAHRYSQQMEQKSSVYNLPIQFKDEKKYSDMVDIQVSVEDFLTSLYGKANQEIQQVPFGGDELTRIRAHKAKYIRSGAHTPTDRLEHVCPIVIENWHAKRAFLSVLWSELYRQDSSRDSGTLKYYRELLQRNNLPSDVTKNYDAAKQFLLLIVRCFVIEAALDFFNMAMLPVSQPGTSHHLHLQLNLSRKIISIWLLESLLIIM